MSRLIIIFFQQAETHIKRRMGIGSHISERRLIDDLTRMGLNESIVSNCLQHMLTYILFAFFEKIFDNHKKLHVPDKESSPDHAPER